MSQLRTKAMFALSRSVVGAVLIGLTITGLLFALHVEFEIAQARRTFEHGAMLIADRARERSENDVNLVRTLAAFYVASDELTAEKVRAFRDAIGGGTPTLFYGFVSNPRGGAAPTEQVMWASTPTAFAVGVLAALRRDCAIGPVTGGTRATAEIDPADGTKYRALVVPIEAGHGRHPGCVVSLFPSGMGAAGAFADPDVRDYHGYLYADQAAMQAPWMCFAGGVGRIECPADAPSRETVMQAGYRHWVAAAPLVSVAGAPRLVVVPAVQLGWLGFADGISYLILVIGTIATAFAARQRFSLARSRFEVEYREQLYRTLIRDVPIAFIGWDGDGRIYEWNPSAERLFGWTAADAIGRQIGERLMASPPATALVLLPPESIEQDVFHEVEICSADGGRFSGDLLLHAMRADGVWRCTAFVRDISELQRSRESVLKAARMVGAAELASGFAHDFNNALTVVIGSLELLAPAVAPQPDAQEDLAAARDAARRAAELAVRMLAMVRERTPLDTELVLDPELAQMLPEIERVAGPRVVVTCALAAPGARVLVDRSWLLSAVLNLVINSRHAMPDGGTLLLATRRGMHPDNAPGALQRSGEFVAIEVCDSGCGMEPAVAARAFETFFTTRPPSIGTGLGLSMVRAFARQRGGDALIESAPGTGTTVRILLPLVAAGAA